MINFKKGFIVALIITTLYSCKTKNNNQNKGNDLDILTTSYLIDSNRVRLGKDIHFRIDTSYYPNRRIESVKTYIDTSANGYAIKFYKNGKVKQLNFYKSGLWNGIQRTFYENGKLEYSGNFKNGFPKYNQSFFYQNGNAKSSYKVIDDIIVGNQYYYSEDGSLKEFVFSDLKSHLKYHRLYGLKGNLLEEEGNPIGNFSVNLHLSLTYYVGDTAHILISVATPPKCSFFLDVVEKNGLYPELKLTDIRKDNEVYGTDYIFKKQDKYNFKLTYTISDSLTNKKKEWSRDLNISVIK